MKWNLLFGSLVLSLGLCTQGFGASLLDRMLGNNCCGHSNCCEPTCGVTTPACEPACGIAEPACCPSDCNTGCHRRGLLDGLLDKRCCRKSCDQCYEPAAPVCGVPAPVTECCEQPCRKSCCNRGKLRGLFGNRCKKSCEPTCGVVDACQPACDVAPAPCDTGCADDCCRKSCFSGCGGLLSRLFSCHRKRSCCSSSCCDTGCTGYGCAPVGPPAIQSEGGIEDGSDVPPAPMVDPSAFLPSPRVIKASTAR